MPHRSSILFGALFVGGLMLIAWLEYYPSSRMFEALGMRGPRANSGRKCTVVHQATMLGFLPSRVLDCRGPYPSSNDVHLSEGVSVDVVTRRLLAATRGWTAPDSAQWMKERDSVALSLVRLGGQPYACVKSKGWLQGSLEAKYWRFSGFYVRLMTHEWKRDPPDRPWWLLDLTASSTIPWECVRNPSALPQREEGCSSEAVIKMPLPGNRVLCVKSSLWN